MPRPVALFDTVAADEGAALVRSSRSASRAATGLADFKQGFQELDRRAAEHRLVVTRLHEARAGLPDETIEPAHLDVVRRRTDERLGDLDEDLAEPTPRSRRSAQRWPTPVPASTSSGSTTLATRPCPPRNVRPSSSRVRSAS